MVSPPVAAAQPTSGGTAPAAPPMTMFCGVSGFSHSVYTNTYPSSPARASAAARTLTAIASWIVQHPERDPEDEPVKGLDPPHQGAGAGAGHSCVAVPLQVVVDGPGAAGGEIAAEHGEDDRGQGRAGRVGDEHRRNRGHQQQRDDPRLGQGQVVAPARRAGGARRAPPPAQGHGAVRARPLDRRARDQIAPGCVALSIVVRP